LRSIVVYPAHRKMKFSVKLEALKGSAYTEIANFVVDRSNVALNVGFEPFAPVAISIPEISSAAYRLHFYDASAGSAVSEIELSSGPKTERYIEKTLAKMYPTPLPYWKEYQWASQPVIKETNTIIQPADVIDISKFMDAKGKLSWNVPAGNWVIRRTGMVSTQVTNGPASKEGTGLETDKMSKKHIRSHFDAFLGQILVRIPAADRKTWKVVVEDSYETGGQNWTDGIMSQFKSVYGYDMLPFLPVMHGEVVGSADQSDRFLWDLRRLIADKVSYDYVAGLREVSHEHGLTTWLENYGHWGFPGEFLQYGGQSDEIGGEFWSEGELGNIENRAASSSAHIYGKRLVSAESFTCGGAAYSRYPAMMKSRGDRFFTEGINNTLLHLCISQPDEERVPGINAGFGNEFNRKNTWYPELGQFIQYLKRCNLMLQQGKYVADVAYFIGEDAPKMTGVRDPELPKGYAYDYMNAEVLKTRITVKNGRLALPDGLSYKILVLPKLETMRPELLARIKELVMQGAVILGPAPLRSPSLQDFGKADKKVKILSEALWGNGQQQTKFRKVGNGLVMTGISLEEAMDYLKMHPDFKTGEKDPVLYIHRSLANSEVYFVSNQSAEEISIRPVFNVSRLQPWLWDATTGKSRLLADYDESSGRTIVPLKLVANESAFIVFLPKTGGEGAGASTNYPSPKTVLDVSGPWNVSFTDQISKTKKDIEFTQLTDWSKRPEEWIKHFSGQAVYTKNIRMEKLNKQTILDLGLVLAIGRVAVNGKDMGGVWTPPYRIDITEGLKTGDNEISITVINTWVNRIIGETALDPAQRKIWMNVNPYKADSPLESSGLLGPVKILGY
ncbi:MAG: glycosyl hydrolase, partial [Chitinophagaceae bacterium]